MPRLTKTARNFGVISVVKANIILVMSKLLVSFTQFLKPHIESSLLFYFLKRRLANPTKRAISTMVHGS